MQDSVFHDIDFIAYGPPQRQRASVGVNFPIILLNNLADDDADVFDELQIDNRRQSEIFDVSRISKISSTDTRKRRVSWLL